MKVYICGPMTGYHMENRPLFREVAATLRSRFPGVQVISADELDAIDPAGHGVASSWTDFLTRDVPWVVGCDAAVVLPGWRESRGATLEATILTALGKPLLRWPEMTTIPPAETPIPVHDRGRGPAMRDQ